MAKTENIVPNVSARTDHSRFKDRDPPAVPDAELSMGASGDEVLALQKNLCFLGYLTRHERFWNDSSGVFEKQTFDALLTLQQDHARGPFKAGVYDGGTKNLIVRKVSSYKDWSEQSIACCVAYQNTYLLGHVLNEDGERITFSTLQDAAQACIDCEHAGGVTLRKKTGMYELRKGTSLKSSPYKEVSWLRTDIDLYADELMRSESEIYADRLQKF
mmetsp:Transcript_34386/g.70919  ORF Transcript_34386/g.70919 Transcript_34386/m.70919 type:complete len:216 (-) Transcript_34386:113-760(-)